MYSFWGTSHPQCQSKKKTSSFLDGVLMHVQLSLERPLEWVTFHQQKAMTLQKTKGAMNLEGRLPNILSSLVNLFPRCIQDESQCHSIHHDVHNAGCLHQIVHTRSSHTQPKQILGKEDENGLKHRWASISLISKGIFGCNTSYGDSWFIESCWSKTVLIGLKAQA